MRPPKTPLIAVLIASPLFAQAPFVEKVEVTVVNVDVTVTDRAGNRVPGLTRDDFEIEEDGVPQAITNFYSVEHSTAAATDDERFRRKVLVLIDALSTTPYARNQALARLEKFIAEHFVGGDYEWSIAALDLELRVLLPPTSDKSAIHEALNEIRRNHAPPLERRMQNLPPTPLGTFLRELEAREDADASAMHIDAITDAIRAFGATSGKKIILFLTGQLLPNDWHMADLPAARAIAEARNGLIREANASNVSVYIINPEGIAAGDPSMYWIARNSGGRLMPGNNVDASLRQFDSRSSTFYSLGYRAPHPEDGRYHRITVRVKHGAYALQYRDGYASLTDQRQLDRTMHSPFGAFMISGSSIPAALTFDSRRGVEDGVIVTMKTSVPADRIVFLPSGDNKTAQVDISISIFDSSGHNVWFVHRQRDANLGREETASGTFNETTEFQLQRGRLYRIVVAVRDRNSDAVGVTQQIIRF